MFGQGERALVFIKYPAWTRKLAGQFLVLIILGQSLPCVAQSSAEGMLIPGGMQAVAKFLGFPAGHRDSFVEKVNRVLLRHVAENDDWRLHRQRTLLVEYLQTVSELEKNFGTKITLAKGDKNSQETFAKLARLFGYRLETRGGAGQLVPRPEKSARTRREVAIALRWDLLGAGKKLTGNETVVFHLHGDRVRTPISLRSWSALCGRVVLPQTALGELSRDQRLGFLLEGLRLATRETARFHHQQLAWLYGNAAERLFRFGSAIEMRNGDLVVPGGTEAVPGWEKMMGKSTRRTQEFVRTLLSRTDFPGLEKWHRLYQSTPPQLAHILSCHNSFAAVWENDLVEASPSRFFPACGGIAGLRATLTQHHLELLQQAQRNCPMALSLIRRMELSDPEVVQNYLSCVLRLSSLKPGVGRHLLVENFQGGVELVRILSQAGHLDQAYLQRWLGQWSLLHLHPSGPNDAASGQLHLLAELLRALPAVEEKEPGRGATEKALLTAMVRRTDPQSFSWQGLNYSGTRAGDLAQRFADHMQIQGIVIADQIVAIDDELKLLGQACRAGARAEVEKLAVSLIRRFNNLPRPVFDQPLVTAGLIGRFVPVDRGKVINILHQVRLTRRISGMESRVEAVRRLTAREIRPFLLSPVYLEAMGESDNLIFQDHNLIRKHTLVWDLDGNLTEDTPWSKAFVLLPAQSVVGTRVAGHLGGVTRAVARLHSGGQPGQTFGGRGQLEPEWFEDSVLSPWQKITPPVSSFVSAAIALGTALVFESFTEEHAGDGRTLEFCRRFVAPVRLEREAAMMRDVGEPARLTEISLSELFLLGYQFACGEYSGGVEPTPVIAARVAALEQAKSELGGDWERRLDCVGAHTPAMDGMARSMVGDWPSYELLECRESLVVMRERLLIDLRLVVIDFLGRHRLPGEMGGDLMIRLLLGAPEELVLPTPREWDQVISWINTVDDRYFTRQMREMFVAGLYRAQLS